MGDGDNDGSGPAASAYYDSDDGEVRYYGHAAGAAEAQVIDALVQRYYAAAKAGNGTAACALTYFIVAETMSENYGEPPGPLWLRGAATCPAVLARVFEHFHRQLSVPVTVTSVRVSGTHAKALLGFTSLPAGVIPLQREGSAWKVAGLLATALP
jgi:hypothetical protein